MGIRCPTVLRRRVSGTALQRLYVRVSSDIDPTAAGPAVTEDVRHREVVPRTTLAHFHHIDPEFTVFTSHLDKLIGPSGAAGDASKLVAVDVSDVGEPLPAADGTPLVGRLAMVLGGPQQVGMGVAGVGHLQPARPKRRQGGAAGEPVIDNRTLR